MVDIPGNTTTTATFLGSASSGASFSGELETFGDSDWIEIRLLAGVTYSFYGSVQGAGPNVGNSFLRVRRPDGTEIFGNDDDLSGGTQNSFFLFTPGTTATYYVDISSATGLTGLYSVAVAAAGGVNNRLSEGPDSYTGGVTEKIIGDKGNDTISIGSGLLVLGEQGDDTITGNNSPNFLSGGVGNDSLHGLGGADSIFGDAGLDFISGGAGNDLLYGGDGADTFFDSSGMDTIHGGEGGDYIEAGADDDTVWGEGGDDQIYGGNGVDTLNGGFGADAMSGGGGNDTFFVDNVGDKTIEIAIDGLSDTVRTTISYTLGAGYEIEKFTTANVAGTAAINMTGNAYGQRIDGNDGNNILQGAGGNDTVVGYAGNDSVRGDAGQDMLYGNTGNDVLIGGTEVDYFIFNTAPNAATNRDTVMDFVHGGDKFWLDNAQFVLLGGAGALNPDFFRLGATALDANDYIVYNNATGALYYDNNGSAAGAAVEFATLATKPILSAGDFVVT